MFNNNVEDGRLIRTQRRRLRTGGEVIMGPCMSCAHFTPGDGAFGNCGATLKDGRPNPLVHVEASCSAFEISARALRKLDEDIAQE